MKSDEKTLDIALLIGAAVSIIIAMITGFVKNCEEMQDKAFRLHILANSDSAADQQTKYEVRDYILSDISARYEKMLAAGATSFWETELGEKDFDDAGSLCHGWSAMPVYYYHTLMAD